MREVLLMVDEWACGAEEPEAEPLTVIAGVRDVQLQLEDGKVIVIEREKLEAAIALPEQERRAA